MSNNRFVLVDERSVAKEPVEIFKLSTTSLWYGPQSPYFAKEEIDVSKLYRHIFFPNKL